jgi:glycosyltransferase involved in cell wall biosynthesis
MVSIIIPSYNRKVEVERAIRSVLNQTYPTLEIIVVDDGSTDGTSDHLRSIFPFITVISNKISTGGAAARNLGVTSARGEYVAFLDSDDEWLPMHLERSLDVLYKSEADGVFSSFCINENGKIKSVPFSIEGLRNGNIGNLILGPSRFDTRTSTFLFKREMFDKVRFDEKLQKHQDWDLAINFDQKFKFEFTQSETVIIHVNKKNIRMSNSLKPESTEYFIIKNSRLLKADNILLFCLKLIYKSESLKQPKEMQSRYLSYCSFLRNDFTLKMRIIYFLLRKGAITATLLYKIKSMF